MSMLYLVTPTESLSNALYLLQRVCMLGFHIANIPQIHITITCMPLPSISDCINQCVAGVVAYAGNTQHLQVVKNACGLAVLKDYHALGKYNIKTVTADEEQGQAA